MATLNIPKRQYAVLKTLAEISDAQFEEILDSLNKIPAASDPFVYAQRFSEKTKIISDESSKHFIMMLCGLYAAKDNNKKTADEIAHDIRETIEGDKPVNFPLDKVTTLEARMLKLLGIDNTIAITAKAYELVTEREKTFCGIRILSDLQPMFTPLANTISAAAVIHTLHISYHEDRAHKEFFVALDNADLRSLREAIDRAEEKSKSLTEMLQKSGISCVMDKA